jgi:hypothetical protein
MQQMEMPKTIRNGRSQQVCNRTPVVQICSARERPTGNTGTHGSVGCDPHAIWHGSRHQREVYHQDDEGWTGQPCAGTIPVRVWL